MAKAPRTENADLAKKDKKEYPWWAVPTVLGIVLLSSGLFVLLLAQSISILSSID